MAFSKSWNETSQYTKKPKGVESLFNRMINDCDNNAWENTEGGGR